MTCNSQNQSKTLILLRLLRFSLKWKNFVLALPTLKNLLLSIGKERIKLDKNLTIKESYIKNIEKSKNL